MPRVIGILSLALWMGLAATACQQAPDPQARRPDPETHPARNPQANSVTAEPSTRAPDVETAVEEAEKR
jgi:hypothetical protein